MAVILYNIFLLFFQLGIRLASPVSAKAAKWVQGRKNLFAQLKAAIPADARIIWFHCASLGEFEQGRPLIEAFKIRFPEHRVLLTFFSPSGYEAQKNYTGADWVFYLPADGPANARRFLEITHPELIIFVKYEFWYYYLKKIKYRNIPLLLVSALFREDMSFFRWYGGLQRKMLARFDHLFVQNENSARLISRIGLGTICSVSGDTRFDRVQAIARRFQPIPEIEQFAGSERVLVAGSTWPDDDEVLANSIQLMGENAPKLIIAPHEITEKHLTDIERKFSDTLRFSAFTPEKANRSRILIIDNVGMLSRLYHYGWITYVGGGLSKNGIHNVLEAAVYGRIVLFGPYYKKYAEAIGLVECGGGIPFEDPDKKGVALQQILLKLQQDHSKYTERAQAAGNFVAQHTGATEKILHYIQENRLLTS